ncbi:hypothetical protein [Kocuria arenosa]|uniref:hypothetical protein n=1 Tax=Kocuria arenosa TaxID=3071446 RepID=UPI0034D69725
MLGVTAGWTFPVQSAVTVESGQTLVADGFRGFSEDLEEATITVAGAEHPGRPG